MGGMRDGWERKTVDEELEKEREYCPNCGDELDIEIEEIWVGRFKNILVTANTAYCQSCGWQETLLT